MGTARADRPREGTVITVGIIANPVSGKDIRRLVAHGSVFDNQEKVRITRRLLLGLDAAGVQRVLYMPDGYCIVDRALENLHLSLRVEPVDMPVMGTQDDSTRAAALMEAAGAGVLLVLGGDGTSRAVYKGARATPLLSLSTGTNNVFPVMVEATVAGLAAGVAASGRFPLEETCTRVSILEVCVDGAPVDLALVDVAVYDDIFQASRAVWSMELVPQLFLSRCAPESIGLSSVGGQLERITPEEPQGLALDLCDPGENVPVVTAAIAPGGFARIGIRRRAAMLPGQEHPVALSPCMLAVDGEREVDIRPGQSASVRLNPEGPWVVGVSRVMERARRAGLFVEGV